MQYPKYLYKAAKNDLGFEAVLVKSAAEEKELEGEHHDSPAKLGIETHPNPAEVAAREVIKEVKKPKGKS
jgi:hypothetical protein